MRKPLAWLGISLASVLSIWAGCSKGASSGTTEGTGGDTTSSSHAFMTGGTGGGTCHHKPDGLCDRMVGEDCNCVDCADTAFCILDGCVDDGKCDHLYDSCICPDCDEDPICADPE